MCPLLTPAQVSKWAWPGYQTRLSKCRGRPRLTGWPSSREEIRWFALQDSIATATAVPMFGTSRQYAGGMPPAGHLLPVQKSGNQLFSTTGTDRWWEWTVQISVLLPSAAFAQKSGNGLRVCFSSIANHTREGRRKARPFMRRTGHFTWPALFSRMVMSSAVNVRARTRAGENFKVSTLRSTGRP